MAVQRLALVELEVALDMLAVIVYRMELLAQVAAVVEHHRLELMQPEVVQAAQQVEMAVLV